ncbi:hypothetical protein [Helicobacter hepaticus]|jgi:hypothetical protein|uniref:Outer membrane protein beta-barrel domain-containing protein n=1 Tax=Helicobacter hepaticus (strain ATCC 51449 / 3B1) TaxID=235279 RepID=Q7VFP6_HELHP|nr:hypothetical protein [Helicobacter hepaticus]AAP78226.1 hypothetical protein HH_1629 [Helicobacter hepaticus ATCC 51449]
MVKKMFLMFVLAGSVVLGAPSNNQKSLGDAKKQLLGNFASGSILSGSNKAGNVARWYLFNEGHLGYSYSSIGDLNLHSADIGYSVYITAIKSASGLRPYIGTEITAPIYLKFTGNSNAFVDGVANGLPGGSKVMQDIGFNGWGVQVPVIVGVQARYFYIQGMVGYAYHSLKEPYFVSDVQNDTSLEHTYHGLTYGIGAGVKVSNVFSVGLRYVMGQMTSSSRTPGASINANAVRPKDFKEDYQRISLIFGVVF